MYDDADCGRLAGTRKYKEGVGGYLRMGRRIRLILPDKVGPSEILCMRIDAGMSGAVTCLLLQIPESLKATLFRND